MTEQLQAVGVEYPIMEETDIAQLAGAFDATGTLTVRINRSDDYSLGYQMRPLMSLTRPSADDPMLGKLMAYSEDENVRYAMNDQSRGAESGVASQEWAVTSPEDIERALEPMVPFLVSQYEEAILMLDQIIPRFKDDKHTSKEGFYELMGFVDLLRESTRRGKEPKYTQAYFGEQWSLTQ